MAAAHGPWLQLPDSTTATEVCDVSTTLAFQEAPKSSQRGTIAARAEHREWGSVANFCLQTFFARRGKQSKLMAARVKWAGANELQFPYGPLLRKERVELS